MMYPVENNMVMSASRPKQAHEYTTVKGTNMSVEGLDGIRNDGSCTLHSRRGWNWIRRSI